MFPELDGSVVLIDPLPGQAGFDGKYVVCSFLCSVGWQPVIADAEGYDILATKGTNILRIQVKSSSGPAIGKGERAPGFYQWTAGLDGKKQLGTPTESYDVLALCALGPDAITFLYASDVTKKTFRIRPGDIHERTSENTWAGITRKLD